eukprot:Phypoly_transcript_06853.p1 GENE.Phypoly_transcript_06853~~Phypoly_transcript_06853.p1  ORF type:complete len:121 (+),score=21.09 Phypoly_transcript_06853:1320-1682(+)
MLKIFKDVRERGRLSIGCEKAPLKEREVIDEGRKSTLWSKEVPKVRVVRVGRQWEINENISISSPTIKEREVIDEGRKSTLWSKEAPKVRVVRVGGKWEINGNISISSPTITSSAEGGLI